MAEFETQDGSERGTENTEKEFSFLKKTERFFAYIQKRLEKILPVVSKFVCLIPPLIVLASMLLLFKNNGLYPYADKTISWCDMDQQVIPLLMDFKDVLSGKEGFFFSFKNAGGMNFYGVFFFFLSSPFTFLIAFVDKAEIASFVNVLVMLKMCTIACTAYIYLSHKHSRSCLLNIALSVLYAYSGYTMLYYQNVIWLDIVYLFPLLLLGLEKLKEGKRTLFVSVLAACMVVNYYLGYMIVVFLLLYAFVWALLTKDKRFAGNFVLCCAVSALLSAIVWLPSLLQYFSSGRTTSIVGNLRNSGMITSYETALPTVFSVLFLFPFAFGADRADKDVKLRFLLFVATLVPLVIEPIAKMWQTGSYMSFPTRYAFITIFLGITLAADRMKKPKVVKPNEEKSEKTLWQKIANKAPRYALNVAMLALAVWYCCFSVAYTAKNVETMDQYSQSLWGNEASFEALFTLYAVAFVVGLTGYLLYRFKLLKPVCLWLSVCVLVVSELYVAPTVYIVPPSHEIDWLQDVTEMADRIDDDSFYRVKSDKEYSGRDFDANLMGALGYNALGHYTSLTGEGYMTSIKRFGYTSYWMEVGNSGGTILSDALLSVKYSISANKADENIVQGDYYGISETFVSLPLGVITANDIIEETDPFTDRATMQKTLYKDVFGKENGVTVYGLNEASLFNLSVEERADGKYALVPENGYGKITFTVYTTETESLYFNVFDENTNALNQSINGKFTVKAPNRTVSGFPSKKNNGLLYLGEYGACAVTITVSLSEETAVSELGVVSIKNERLAEEAENVRSIGLKAGKNKLVGTYTATGGECVFLSVPYDEGLSLRINGRKTELYRVYEGFTAFYLEKGENEIEIKFAPQGFGFGCALSVVGLGLCAAACVLWIWKKKPVKLPSLAEKVAYIGVIVAGVAVLALVYVLPVLLCAL